MQLKVKRVGEAPQTMENSEMTFIENILDW
jgi:hypothetical protein